MFLFKVKQWPSTSETSSSVTWLFTDHCNLVLDPEALRSGSNADRTGLQSGDPTRTSSRPPERDDWCGRGQLVRKRKAPNAGLCSHQRLAAE